MDERRDREEGRVWDRGSDGGSVKEGDEVIGVIQQSGHNSDQFKLRIYPE